MAILKYKLVGDIVDREVDVDDVGVKGAFLFVKKGDVLELLPAHTLLGAVVVPDGES